MTPNEFRTNLRDGKQLFGTLLAAQTPFWPKIIANCGLDFVFIDTEHIAIGRESLSWMCRTYSAMGLPPLVRITRPNPDDATVALDDGAAGVVAPYVEQVSQVRQLVGAAKFRPLKGDKLEQALANRETLEPELAAYIEQHTSSNTLVVNIESVPAMENLDAILEVDGLDAVLIGPHDLSCSLGVPERYQDSEFLNAVETILGRARGAGVGAGIHFWGTIEEHVRFIGMGANLFIHKADAIIFRESLTRELSELREQVGARGVTRDSESVNI